jgi:dCMP deaminase
MMPPNQQIAQTNEPASRALPPSVSTERLTNSFAEATTAAVRDLHARGLPAHGTVDGVWAEVPPPVTIYDDPPLQLSGDAFEALRARMGSVERPSWHSIWMQVADVIAQKSIDPRLKVSAIVVSGDNTQVLAIGYNGDQRGGANRVESLEPGKSGLIHAEENALIKLDFSFPKRKVMYVTSSPCDMCAKKIINAGIDEVVYRDEYRDRSGIERLHDAGIKIWQLTS